MKVTEQPCGCVLLQCPCGEGLQQHLDPLGLTIRDLFCAEHKLAYDRGEPVPTVFKRQVPVRRWRRR
jgi:hypothetical protein